MPTQLIASTRMDATPHISPDGSKIAFCSSRTGNVEVWVCDSDGTDPVRLTDFGSYDTSSPYWSPDGRSIVFNSNQAGHMDIYVVSSEAGPVVRLTTEASREVNPSWSRDGRWIYFSSNRGGIPQIWRVPAEGGQPVQITTNGGYAAEESMDGRFLYYVPESGRTDLWRMSVEGGEETLILEGVRYLAWALTKEGIYLLNPYLDSKPSLQFYDFSRLGPRGFLTAPGKNNCSRNEQQYYEHGDCDCLFSSYHTLDSSLVNRFI